MDTLTSCYSTLRLSVSTSAETRGMLLPQRLKYPTKAGEEADQIFSPGQSLERTDIFTGCLCVPKVALYAALVFLLTFLPPLRPSLISQQHVKKITHFFVEIRTTYVGHTRTQNVFRFRGLRNGRKGKRAVCSKVIHIIVHIMWRYLLSDH